MGLHHHMVTLSLSIFVFFHIQYSEFYLCSSISTPPLSLYFNIVFHWSLSSWFLLWFFFSLCLNTWRGFPSCSNKTQSTFVVVCGELCESCRRSHTIHNNEIRCIIYCEGEFSLIYSLGFYCATLLLGSPWRGGAGTRAFPSMHWELQGNSLSGSPEHHMENTGRQTVALRGNWDSAIPLTCVCYSCGGKPRQKPTNLANQWAAALAWCDYLSHLVSVTYLSSLGSAQPGERCLRMRDFSGKLWFSALCCVNHISPGKLLALAGEREAGREWWCGVGWLDDVGETNRKSREERGESTWGVERNKHRKRRREGVSGIISQVSLWFLTQTRWREFLKDTWMSSSYPTPPPSSLLVPSASPPVCVSLSTFK